MIINYLLPEEPSAEISLTILDEAGYAGPLSAEVEFTELGWPDYDACRVAAKRSVENLRGMDLNV